MFNGVFLKCIFDDCATLATRGLCCVDHAVACTACLDFVPCDEDRGGICNACRRDATDAPYGALSDGSIA